LRPHQYPIENRFKEIMNKSFQQLFHGIATLNKIYTPSRATYHRVKENIFLVVGTLMRASLPWIITMEYFGDVLTKPYLFKTPILYGRQYAIL